MLSGSEADEPRLPRGGRVQPHVHRLSRLAHLKRDTVPGPINGGGLSRLEGTTGLRAARTPTRTEATGGTLPAERQASLEGVSLSWWHCGGKLCGYLFAAFVVLNLPGAEGDAGGVVLLQRVGPLPVLGRKGLGHPGRRRRPRKRRDRPANPDLAEEKTV